jgi:hypothetical protein
MITENAAVDLNEGEDYNTAPVGFILATFF